MDLFTLLAECLGPDESLRFDLRRDGAGLTVLALPRLDPHSAPAAGDPALRATREALALPLVLRGTPEALDRDLPARLAAYAATRRDLRAVGGELDALEAALREGRQAASDKRQRAAQAGAAPATAPDPGGAPAAPASPGPATNPDSLF